MSRKPTETPSRETTAAWARLVRVQQGVLAAVERDLKKAGHPPLAWYDALLELARAPDGAMRPRDLEKHMLLPQYSTSRLVDRLVEAGLAERKTCPVDGRGQFVAITAAGPRPAEEDVGHLRAGDRAPRRRQAQQQGSREPLRFARPARVVMRCHRRELALLPPPLRGRGGEGGGRESGACRYPPP